MKNVDFATTAMSKEVGLKAPFFSYVDLARGGDFPHRFTSNEIRRQRWISINGS